MALAPVAAASRWADAVATPCDKSCILMLLGQILWPRSSATGLCPPSAPAATQQRRRTEEETDWILRPRSSAAGPRWRSTRRHLVEHAEFTVTGHDPRFSLGLWRSVGIHGMGSILRLCSASTTSLSSCNLQARSHFVAHHVHHLHRNTFSFLTLSPQN